MRWWWWLSVICPSIGGGYCCKRSDCPCGVWVNSNVFRPVSKIYFRYSFLDVLSILHNSEYYQTLHLMKPFLFIFLKFSIPKCYHVQVNIVHQSITQRLFYIQGYICQGDTFRPSRSSSGPPRKQIQELFSFSALWDPKCLQVSVTEVKVY